MELIRESWRCLPGDPGEAYHRAELTRFIVHRPPGTPESFGLVALASACMANARRAGGELREAEEHFQYVRYVITHQGVTDPWVIAQIDHLEGSLRKDQRRFSQAEVLLARAVMLFKLSGSRVEAARVLLALGSTYFSQGLLSRAIDTVPWFCGKAGRSPGARPPPVPLWAADFTPYSDGFRHRFPALSWPGWPRLTRFPK